MIQKKENMKEILNEYPEVCEYAGEAMQKIGIKPVFDLIRGGTDGSRMSFMGMPCPNIFTGEMAIHSRQEYVVVQDMEKSREVLVHLAGLWASH